jgi:porphobilinogen synthase
VQVALRDLRDDLGDSMVLCADLCVDEYTDHGHCGVLDGKGSVDNDATLDLYRRIAVAQATAGADVIAPSGMMDGQVAAIRSALDGAGFDDRIILAYSAKYASALYGPFRDASMSPSPTVAIARAISKTSATPANPSRRCGSTSPREPTSS